MTLREVYEEVNRLQLADRVRLASLILSDIAVKPVDYSDDWTDEDLRDATLATRAHIERMIAEEEDDTQAS
jgi:hypothetical protein